MNKTASFANKAMTTFDHALINQAKSLPINTPSPVISISPIVLSSPGRLVDLQIRVSAPSTGTNLPILILSHGHGKSNNLSSSNGYGPLSNFWAAHGFVVIQPTHLSSKTLSFPADTPGAPLFWKSRVEDVTRILDQLDNIEEAAPFIKGKLDKSKIAVAGHSAGTHTSSLLLGAQLTDPEDGTRVNMIEPRIKAGVLLAAVGNGGADLSPFAAEHYPFLGLEFPEMKTPALVVTGDSDDSSYLTTRGVAWHADAFTHGTGPKSLLTLYGAGHILGGISGYDVAETGDDESPERVAAVQRMTWAYLRSTLYPEDPAWSDSCAALDSLKSLGKVESK